MNKIISLYDKINLVDLPAMISEHCKRNSNLSLLDTREKVTIEVFDRIMSKTVLQSNDNSKITYGMSIRLFLKKYASSDTPRENSSLTQLGTELYENEEQLNIAQLTLYRGCLRLVKMINQHKNFEALYGVLFSHCNFINFPDKLITIETFYRDTKNPIKSKAVMLSILYAHAIKNYKLNLPKFYCSRLYYEALTLSYGSEMQKRMFKEAADICANYSQKSLISCESAIQYANLVYNQVDEAFKYFLIASEKLPSAFWEIGFLIEHHKLTKSQVVFVEQQINSQFNQELKDIALIDSKINIAKLKKKNLLFRPIKFNNTSEEYDLKVCFKIYWSIANKFNFTKGINSVGKLLIQKSICVINPNTQFIDEEQTSNLAIEYLTKAMSLGNTNAMVNLGNYYYEQYKNNNFSEVSKTKMLELLKNSSDIFCEHKACSILGDYYFDRKNLDLAREYYLKSIKQKPNNGYANFMLGRISYIAMDYENAMSYYDKALRYEYYDASYYYAKALYSIYIRNVQHQSRLTLPYLNMATDIIYEYSNFVSPKVKEKAESLVKDIELIKKSKWG